MGSGGIGAFAQGFTGSLTASRNQRLLRDQMNLENQQKAERELRLREQFEQGMEFKEKQFEETQKYHNKSLDMQQQTQDALGKWRTGQEEIQRKQLELNTKAQDMKVMDQWNSILDPKHSKARRKFMFKQFATTTLEMDPKSEAYKDFEKYITSEEDDALDRVRKTMMTMIPGMKPGEALEVSKSVVSGDVPFLDAVKQFQEMAKERARAEGATLGGGGAGGAPVNKVQTSAITSPTPMAEQGMTPPGGTLPVPGMEAQTGGDGEQTISVTPAQMRQKAIEMAQRPDLYNASEVGNFLAAARDLEASNKPNLELKQIVTTDKDGNRTEKWVTEADALGKEAPSGRPVPSKAEARDIKEAEALAAQDVKRVEPILEAGSTARTTIAQIADYRKLLESGKFETGSFADFRSMLGQVGRFIGLEGESLALLDSMKIGDPAVAEAMNSLDKQLSLTFASEVSRLTNMSLELIQGGVTSLSKTPEGNSLILEFYENKAKQAIEIDDEYEKYVSKYGTLRPEGKPSFFESANKIKRKSIAPKNFEERFTKAKKLGDGIDIQKVFREKDNVIKVDKVDYEVTGKHKESGLSIIKISPHVEVPYAKTPEDVLKLEKGDWFFSPGDPDSDNPKLREPGLRKRK